MLMTWRSLLFIHWPVPAEALQPLVPEPLEIDTFDGRAWVGLIPFTMPRVRMTRLPVVPTTRRFHECNVRTYVTDRDQPGVYFFSLDATSRLAVWCARRFWHLNYRFSRIDVHQEGDVIHYAVDRAGDPAARMRCAWRGGSTREQSKPGELAYFLTERYMLYTVNRQGRLLGGRIWHRPWPLRDAELLELDDGLVWAAGITIPDETPVLYHADELHVRAWPLEPVRSAPARH